MVELAAKQHGTMHEQHDQLPSPSLSSLLKGVLLQCKAAQAAIAMQRSRIPSTALPQPISLSFLRPWASITSSERRTIPEQRRYEQLSRDSAYQEHKRLPRIPSLFWFWARILEHDG